MTYIGIVTLSVSMRKPLAEKPGRVWLKLITSFCYFFWKIGSSRALMVIILSSMDEELIHKLWFELISGVKSLFLWLFYVCYPFSPLLALKVLKWCGCYRSLPFCSKQSTRFEKGWFSLWPTEFIQSNPFLFIGLRKHLYTAGCLNISERVWSHIWHPYVSPDKTRLFKNMTREVFVL